MKNVQDVPHKHGHFNIAIVADCKSIFNTLSNILKGWILHFKFKGVLFTLSKYYLLFIFIVIYIFIRIKRIIFISYLVLLVTFLLNIVLTYYTILVTFHYLLLLYIFFKIFHFIVFLFIYESLVTTVNYY